MPIIAILNPKGGCGKTTLATHIARALLDRGGSVLLVDTDPQGSARDWHAATEGNVLPIVGMDRAANLNTLPRIARDYQYTLIDGAAKLEDMAAASITVADVVLIPVHPSPYDIWAVSDLAESIGLRQTITGGAPLAAFVVSRAIQHTKLAQDALDALRDTAFPTFQARTVQRQVYPQSAADGLTVFDLRHAKAIAEINGLTDELLRLIER